MVASSGELTWSTKFAKHGSHPSGEPRLDSRPAVGGVSLPTPSRPSLPGASPLSFVTIQALGSLLLVCRLSGEVQCPPHYPWFHLHWVKVFLS